MRDNKIAFEDRIKGSLFGFAIGDLIGTEEETGEVTGRVSDDTGLTLALLKGLLADPEYPLDKIGDYFLEWYKNDGTGIGQLTEMAFKAYEEKDSWEYAVVKAHENSDHRSAGNGSLMRTLPISLFYDDLSTILDWSKCQSYLTHYDLRCQEACQMYNWLAFELLHGRLKADALKEVVGDHLHYGLYRETSINELSGSAFVPETLLAVLTILYRTESFESLLEASTQVSGDKDTVGALTCGLGGLYYGFKALPKEAINRLKPKDEINQLCQQLIDYKVKIGGKHAC